MKCFQRVWTHFKTFINFRTQMLCHIRHSIVMFNKNNVLQWCKQFVNKNTKVRSCKSNEHIRKKVDGPYFEVSAKKASSVTL